jgi:activator of 2-hydroxyglutaryl-CoA dehydratase
MGKIYDLGIDVGSTTVKTVILDEGEFIYNKYERHFSKVRETVGQVQDSHNRLGRSWHR